MDKLKRLKRIRPINLIMLTFSGILNAIGVTIFLAPVDLYDSGVSGTSMFLSQITPSWLSLSIFLLALNIPLFLYGLKKEGLLFTFYGIYSVSIYALCAWLITDILPIDVRFASPLAGTDLLLCALFGGVICGTAVGLSIRFGGALDGIEVLAIIISKKIGITVGTFCMIYNFTLYIICGIVLKSWILPLYSIVTYFAALKMVDYIVDGLDRAKCAIIITNMPDEICRVLSEEFETGMTRIEAKGGYSNIEKTMIYFVVNRFQVSKMKDIVHAVDRNAFITISDVADVFSSNQSK